MKIKRTLSILLSLVLLFSFVTPALAAEIEPSSQITPRIDPERQKTENFSYTFRELLPGGQFGNTLITTDIVVTGMYSQVDGTAYLTNITVSISGPEANIWSCRYPDDISALNTDHVSLMYMRKGSIQFQIEFEIHTNGNISADYTGVQGYSINSSLQVIT